MTCACVRVRVNLLLIHHGNGYGRMECSVMCGKAVIGTTLCTCTYVPTFGVCYIVSYVQYGLCTCFKKMQNQ